MSTRLSNGRFAVDPASVRGQYDQLWKSYAALADEVERLQDRQREMAVALVQAREEAKGLALDLHNAQTECEALQRNYTRAEEEITAMTAAIKRKSRQVVTAWVIFAVVVLALAGVTLYVSTQGCGC